MTDATDSHRDDATMRVDHELTLLGRHMTFVTHRLRDDSAFMERSAFTMLSRIDEQGPMSIGELSDAFGLDASTVNRQTAALVHAGTAERIPDPDGGVARKFRLTVDGRRRLRRARAAQVQSQQRVLATWSADDIAAFATMLERYNIDIERAYGRPWPRPSSGEAMPPT